MDELGLLAIYPARSPVISLISRWRWTWLLKREIDFNPERWSNCICPTERSNGASQFKISWRSWSCGSLVKPQMTAAFVHDGSYTRPSTCSFVPQVIGCFKDARLESLDLQLVPQLNPNSNPNLTQVGVQVGSDVWTQIYFQAISTSTHASTSP